MDKAVLARNLARAAKGALKKPCHPLGARNPAQDRMLSKGEIEKLKKAGIDVHDLKGQANASSRDLYKDKDGNIFVKPKGGAGD